MYIINLQALVFAAWTFAEHLGAEMSFCTCSGTPLPHALIFLGSKTQIHKVLDLMRPSNLHRAVGEPRMNHKTGEIAEN